MWSSVRTVARSSSGYLREIRSLPTGHRSYREASVSSLIPFGWLKKSEETPQALIQEQATNERDVIPAQSKVIKFEKQEEKFIPVTRRTLVNKLVEEDGLLNWEEKRLMESFAASLDAYYSQKFYALLEEAKVRW